MLSLLEQLEALEHRHIVSTINSQEPFIIDGRFHYGAWSRWWRDGCVKDPSEYLKGDGK